MPAMEASHDKRSNPTDFEDGSYYVIDVSSAALPMRYRYAMETAVELVQRLDLPCDVSIQGLTEGKLASHRLRKDGTCQIVLSASLVENQDRTAVHHCTIHECAHHLAGHGAGHGPEFKRVANELYTSEGYAPGPRGSGWGTLGNRRAARRRGENELGGPNPPKSDSLREP